MSTFFSPFDDLPSRDVYAMQMAAIRKGYRQRRNKRLLTGVRIVSALISAIVTVLALAAFL